MSLNYLLKTNAMFDMIVYVSTPYSAQHLESITRARAAMQKYFANFYKLNPKAAAVNAIFSFPNDITTLTDKEIFTAAVPLMRSSGLHIVLRQPNWGYSPILIQECALAHSLNIPTTFEDI